MKWIGHQDGRMRGDDKLAALANELVDADERGHLTRRRQRGFGFVEEVETFRTESMFEERDERFAMGLFVQ
jgi:hypothetical protein